MSVDPRESFEKITSGETYRERDIDNVNQALDELANFKQMLNGIYIFDKLGKVHIIFSPKIQSYNIYGNIGTNKFNYKLADVGTRFFVSKEECELKAKEYLERVSKYIPLNVLKKISRLKGGDTFYYIRYDGKVDQYELGDKFWFDKQKLELVDFVDYDTDYGGEEEDCHFPLEKYGETWSFRKGDLEK